MNKAHENQDWENFPSVNTPVNAQNLNKLDRSVDEIDDRVIEQDAVKATKEEVAPLVTDIEFDEQTGIFTITRKNGVKYTIDTLLETILTNWEYDKENQRLILTMENGEKQYVDLSALITQYEFVNTDTISFTIGSDGKVSAKVIDGSIGENHLRPNYLADIKVESAKAVSAKEAAQTSEQNAKASETASANSAKESAESAKSASASAATATEKAESASESATLAEGAKNSANASAETANTKANEAAQSALTATNSATTATNKATEAANSAKSAQDSDTKSISYAVGGTSTRVNEETDNAKYYYQQSKSIYDKFISAGDVTGVKGSVETEYRHGDVSLSAENVGALPLNGKANSAKTADTATTASKVAQALTIQVPSEGNTTYDGSVARTINVGVEGIKSGSVYKSGLVTLAATDITVLSTVATSGSYTDLINKPTIPTVNNGTLTIQKNGTQVATFTANQSNNVVANITESDANVAQTATTANASYPLLLSSLTTNGTRGVLFDSGVTLNPSNNTIAASISGNAATVGGKTVAELQNYNNLTNKPTIPAAYTLPLATSSVRGGAKIGYSENGRNYAVKLSSEQMYVTVPWTDTNTNTDVNVTQNTTTANANYPLLLSNSTAAGTRQAYFDTGVYLNPSTNVISASISGNAATATKATQDGSGNNIVSTYATKSELNSNLQDIIKRKTIKKTINNAAYTTIAVSEIGLAYILDVNIVRHPDLGYHFVVGWGTDSSDTLFVYFDGAITASVNIMIHYFII